jgi:hypothetical protein
MLAIDVVCRIDTTPRCYVSRLSTGRTIAKNVAAHVIDTKEQYARKEYVMPTYSNVSQVHVSYHL